MKINIVSLVLQSKCGLLKCMQSLDNYCRTPEFWKIQICIDVDITSQYLGTSYQHFVCMHYWFHVFLPVFFPVSSGRNWKKYLFPTFFHSSRMQKKPISSRSFQTLILLVTYKYYKISLIEPQDQDKRIEPYLKKRISSGIQMFYTYVAQCLGILSHQIEIRRKFDLQESSMVRILGLQKQLSHIKEPKCHKLISHIYIHTYIRYVI